MYLSKIKLFVFVFIIALLTHMTFMGVSVGGGGVVYVWVCVEGGG